MDNSGIKKRLSKTKHNHGMVAMITKGVETIPYGESLNEDGQTRQEINHCVHNSKSPS